MHIIKAGGLEKSYGERTLFSGAGFEINEKDRIGLVGANGAGKTTLFRLLTGEEPADAGGFAAAPGIKIGYMRQHVPDSGEKTAPELVIEVFGELMALESEIKQLEARIADGQTDAKTLETHHALLERFHREGGLTYKARSRSALTGLGFSGEELTLPVSALSGGQRSKISLARLLVSEPELLLLDEPTNHLDVAAVEWLEEYLRGYGKAAVIISHDRYFLDRVTTRTFEITNGALYVYTGGYTASMAERQRRREIIEKQYKDKMKEINRLERMIEQQRRWNRERNIRMAEHKQKQLDRLEAELINPEKTEQTVKFTFKPTRPTGQDVLLCEGLKKQFGDKILYENAEIQLYKHERIFLLGRNGCGKTTLLRQIVADEPGVRFGLNIKLGYYDQTQELLKPENTVFDEISDTYPALGGTEIRNALAAFLFKGTDVFKRIGELSGGEKARVSLLKLMLSGANLLILDEPTNHLDIGGREALEAALLAYSGSMLIVSHDRYFINKCAGRIYELTPDGTRQYAGNYDYYLARRNSGPEFKAPAGEKAEKPVNDYREKKERASALRRLETKTRRAERRAQELGDEISLLKEKLESPENSADYEGLLALTAELARLQAEEDEAVREWEESARSLEELLKIDS